MTTDPEPADLAAALRDFTDRTEITDLVYNYNHSLDEREPELFATLWAPTAVWNFVKGFGEFVGYDTIVAAFDSFWSFHETMHHCTTNLVLQFGDDPDRARGRSKSIGRAVASSGRVHESFISYDDEFVRHNGRWKFLDRQIRVHIPNELEPESVDALRSL